MNNATLSQLQSDKDSIVRKVQEMVNEFKEKYPLVEFMDISISKEVHSISIIGQESSSFIVSAIVTL